MAFEMAIAVQTPLAPPDISSPNNSFANFSFIISTSFIITCKPNSQQVLEHPADNQATWMELTDIEEFKYPKVEGEEEAVVGERHKPVSGVTLFSIVCSRM
jgi:hypothetical protein